MEHMKIYLFSADVEGNLAFLNINVRTRCYEEITPQQKRGMGILFHFNNYKIYGYEVLPNLDYHIFNNTFRVPYCFIGQLQRHSCWFQIYQTQPLVHRFWHKAYTSPKITKTSIKFGLTNHAWNSKTTGVLKFWG